MKISPDLRAALMLFAVVRVPWLLLTGSVIGFFPMGHGATAMPALGGPEWAQLWLRWDSGWYVQIVRQGFSASHCGESGGVCEQASISFLPAFPLALRGLTELGLSIPLASFLLNGLCLVVTIWGLRRLTALTIGGDAPRRAAWALLAFPTTLFFSAGYAEAMFAAASIWGMVFVAEDRALPAALALAGATMSRPHGVVLVACVVFGALLRKRVKIALTITLVAAAVFTPYLAWQAREFGDPIAFLHARRAWTSTRPAFETLRDYWNRTNNSHPFTVFQDLSAALMLGIAGLWSLRRLPVEYGLFCLLLLALPLAQGQVWGMSRAVLGAFPIFLMLASVGSRWRAPLAFLGLTVATIDAVLFVHGYFVS